MAWTDDRVAKLSKLWADGLSASQIAAELGGVTRNAVIGKVHRLGLSGRVKSNTGGGAKPRRKPTTTARTASSTGTYQRARPSTGRTNKAKAAPDVDGEVLTKPVESLVAPESKKLTLLEITEFTCKWPHGDPTMPGFSFCGHKTKDDKPYCEFHNKLAFQPPSERRRRR
ncbi:GcrA family cell cycle regulator [Pseudahrensia aquimaris]|uniref:GcrA family cell cycle regulator n=1 Tax=Pseudahrensia aquimaris TaxID=744461 RepID=A0ABW3FJG5_9HYPH